VYGGEVDSVIIVVVSPGEGRVVLACGVDGPVYVFVDGDSVDGPVYVFVDGDSVDGPVYVFVDGDSVDGPVYVFVDADSVDGPVYVFVDAVLKVVDGPVYIGVVLLAQSHTHKVICTSFTWDALFFKNL
jgi:hypothetical protein